MVVIMSEKPKSYKEQLREYFAPTADLHIKASILEGIDEGTEQEAKDLAEVIGLIIHAGVEGQKFPEMAEKIIASTQKKIGDVNPDITQAQQARLSNRLH